jgi:hypothetical protein
MDKKAREKDPIHQPLTFDAIRQPAYTGLIIRLRRSLKLPTGTADC